MKFVEINCSQRCMALLVCMAGICLSGCGRATPWTYESRYGVTGKIYNMNYGGERLAIWAGDPDRPNPYYSLKDIAQANHGDPHPMSNDSEQVIWHTWKKGGQLSPSSVMEIPCIFNAVPIAERRFLWQAWDVKEDQFWLGVWEFVDGWATETRRLSPEALCSSGTHGVEQMVGNASGTHVVLFLSDGYAEPTDATARAKPSDRVKVTAKDYVLMTYDVKRNKLSVAAVLDKEHLQYGETQLAISEDGQWVAIAVGNGCKVVHVESQRIYTVTGKNSEGFDYYFSRIALSPDGKTLFFGNIAGQIRQIDVATNKVISEHWANAVGSDIYGLRTDFISISPDGRWMAVGMRPFPFVAIRDLHNDGPMHFIQFDEVPDLAAFSPDSAYLMLAGGDKIVTCPLPIPETLRLSPKEAEAKMR